MPLSPNLQVFIEVEYSFTTCVLCVKYATSARTILYVRVTEYKPHSDLFPVTSDLSLSESSVFSPKCLYRPYRINIQNGVSTSNISLNLDYHIHVHQFSKSLSVHFNQQN